MSFSNPLLLLLIPPLIAFIALTGLPRAAFRRRRAIASIVIRAILITLMIMALAGFQVPQQIDRLSVVFLVDVSDSMSPRQQDAAVDYVRTALEELDPERDQAAVILFGGNALVEQPMATRLDLSQLGADPITLNTDMAEAIRLGLAIFPPESAKRMVILSDGVQTTGDADSAARLAAATDVQIDYVPFAREVLPGEVLVSDVTLPPRVNEDEIFDLIVNVESESETSAELRVLAAGEIIHTQTVALEPGDNRIAVGPLALPDTGFVDFRVQVEPQGADGYFQNNELSAFTEVRGRTSVLLVAPDPREVEFLRPALEENGLRVETVTPREMPTGLAALSEYASIVLVDTPAAELSANRMELLQLYVRDLGGGLVAVGGPNSYGVGGYFETPLEETLPVEMRIRDQERIPSLTMLFVIDRSGSMEMASGPRGFTNLELAKEAILRSFSFLNEFDRTGVISFDTGAYFVVDLQEVGDASNQAQLESEVQALRPGGGTDILGALQNAARILPNDPSALKHMILLTDGGATPGNSIQIAEQLNEQYGITLSVVAVGQNYAPWLRNLAEAGQGNFHEAFDVSTIPAIFSAETVLATRSYIFEEEFTPAQTGRSPILDGIEAVPSLQGYVATTEKDTATVIFRTPEDDPLLASWQYGLGRAVAFTSDASARWGVNWVTWEQYTRFWGQAVRWTITEGRDNFLEVGVEQRGEQAVLTVDARDDDGAFLNGLNLNASVISPELESEALTIPQVAPGRYEIPFTPEDEGAYFVRVAGGAQGDVSVAQSAGWVLSYSAEYELRPTDQRFLNNLAGITGGDSLADNPAGAFAHNLVAQNADQPAWPWLLAIAAFLLVLDIAVRRIIITRSDIQLAAQTVGKWFGIGQGEARRTATTGRMSGLMDAKKRASGEFSQTEIQGQATTQQPPTSGASRTSRPARSRANKRANTEKTTTSSLASRLLETRRDGDDGGENPS
ncbi:MAG: VWA domain-containing protein [Anaerolineales bacterium]